MSRKKHTFSHEGRSFWTRAHLVIFMLGAPESKRNACLLEATTTDGWKSYCGAEEALGRIVFMVPSPSDRVMAAITDRMIAEPPEPRASEGTLKNRGCSQSGILFT